MTMKGAFGLIRKAAAGWVADRASSMGAALSYYTVFSIAPLLVIVIAIAGLVFGADAARGAIVEQLQGLLGEQAAQTIQEMLANASEPKTSMLATVAGFLLVLVGATTVFAELQDDLDRIWKVPQRAKPQGAWGWVRARILSFGMVLAIGFLLLVSLVASAAITAVGAWGGGLFGDWEVLAHVVEVVVSFALLAALFAVMYRFLPDVRIAWRDVWVGAIATALLFTVGKFLIGLYIGKSGTASTFGAAGSLVVLLLWVYYSAQIFLFGAEFTAAYAQAYGSRPAQPAVETGAAAGVELPRQPEPSTSSSPLPTGQPGVAAAGRAAATSDRLPAPAAAPEPHGIATSIARHPARAISVAAGLGAVTGLLLQRWQRARHPEARRGEDVRGARFAVSPALRRARTSATHRPSPSARIARAVASALASAFGRVLAKRLKRGARRGWKTGTEHAA